MSTYDDEIDLRPYLVSVIRRWKLIIVAVIFLAAVFSAIKLISPRSYEASSSILLTRSRAELNLAEQFPTVQDPVDSKAKMDAIMNITGSDFITNKVKESISDKKISEMTLVQFRAMVAITSQGDLIIVSVTADKPELASQISDTWAMDTVQIVNQAYSRDISLDEIQKQVNDAEQDYQQAQNSLEAFIQNNQIDVLTKQSQETQNLLNKLSEDRTHQINFFIARKQYMGDIVVQAEALKKQFDNGSNSPASNLGDALAVINARAEAMGLSVVNLPAQNQPIQLQLTNSTDLLENRANYQSDLDTIIQQAKQEQASAEKSLEDLVNQVVQDQNGNLINITATQLRTQKTELEVQQARQNDLTNQRDLKFTAYQTLMQKQTEIKSGPQGGNEVNIANLSVLPRTPAPRGMLKFSAIGAFLGLVLGLGIAIGMELLKSTKKMLSEYSAVQSQEKVESTLAR